jgi:hypothetical protein
MFRHQGAIIREFINNKQSQVQPIYQMLVAHTSIVRSRSLVDKLPEDGILVPKHVGVATNLKCILRFVLLYFNWCILLV